jgi:hypothetical protein
MIKTTPYYSDFLRYYQLAKTQQRECNVSDEAPFGMLTHAESSVDDDLMRNIELFDVVERKYAGFSQIVNDCFYGWTKYHPYWAKMAAGQANPHRNQIARDWTDRGYYGINEWLYIFILHRVCGSAINYAQKPSGYHNTILSKLHRAKTIEDMCEMVKNETNSFYTSVGYQFPQFPKPPARYKRGGDYFLCEYAPLLARSLGDFLKSGPKKSLREAGAFMLDWNTAQGLKRYHFQYAAVVADIADWYPEFVDRNSLFFYGSNATKCIAYLAERPRNMASEEFLDTVISMACKDTVDVPYNIEDVCCDYIRYVENYVRPGDAYSHVDRDKIFNSSRIIHPYGRQKAMLDLGLIRTFNTPGCDTFAGDHVISEAGMSEVDYVMAVKSHPDYQDWIDPQIYTK